VHFLRFEGDECSFLALKALDDFPNDPLLASNDF
jgi:hypothetical protein